MGGRRVEEAMEGGAAVAAAAVIATGDHSNTRYY
jgi:hypothetical protein